MRRFPLSTAGLALGVLAASFLYSCAGAPATKSIAAPPPPPAPVRKERIVVTQVPYLVKETVFYPDGLVDEYSVFAYDPTNRTLLSKTTFDTSRADPIEKAVFELGADGRVSAELTYGSDGALKTRRELEWGGAGGTLLKTERVLDAAGLLQNSSTWEYDSGGRKTVWKTYDSKGVLKATTLYKYDAGGRILQKEMRNGADALTGSIKVEWAADGGEKDSYLAADGALQKYEQYTWKDGRVVRFEIRRPDGGLVEATDLVYGARGERLGSVTSDGSGKTKEKLVAEYALREEQKAEVYYE